MYLFYIVATTWLVVSATVPNCPEKTALSPCTCDGEGLNCRKAKNENQIQKSLTARADENIIRSIYIQGTPIKKLQSGIFGRYQFGEFHLDANQIATVEPGVFIGSRNLVSLISLYRNKITSFPFNDIEKLPHLEKLMLSKNELTTIPGPSAFGTHAKLQFLLLGSNKISRIAKRAFSGLSVLQALDLSDNKLVNLDSQTFSMAYYNPYIEISVDNNSISAVAKDAFSGTSPAAVYLRYNQLSSFPEEPFKNMMVGTRTPTVVDVQGNAFNCRGCGFRWVVNYKMYIDATLQGFRCTNGRDLATITSSSIGC